MVNFGIIVGIVKIDFLKLTTNVCTLLFGKLFYLASARHILIWHLKIKKKNKNLWIKRIWKEATLVDKLYSPERP